ncbi:MAG: Hsp70 family protein [Rhodobacteraceae bacterium]|nr:Hsp70 family protein [Paracoccaceae bacterium]
MQAQTLAIDFGTSNTAVGFMLNGAPVLLDIEPNSPTLPTSIFFDYDSRETLVGTPANKALIDGEYGRFMRALKSVLGTSIMHEKRRLMDEQMDFIEIISRFLREIKTRAETASGLRFNTALSGRPVHFHSNDPQKDAQALADLRACYLAAGFTDVEFMLEPEAAALANHSHLAQGTIGMIVDIGGGTSDFTIFEIVKGGIRILASHGVRVGGTDFDRKLSIDHIMPLLGKGSQICKAFGNETMPTPNAIFHNLATWQKIPFMYTREIRREADELFRYAAEPALLKRLADTLENELGHDLAFAAEHGKIAANIADAEIDLSALERRLTAPLSQAALGQSLEALTAKIKTAAAETLASASLTPDQISSLIFVGGSSLMGVVEATLQSQFPTAKPHRTSAFTAVIEGLTLATR